MQDLYAAHVNALQPEVKDNLVEDVRDLVKLVSTRTREIRGAFAAIRRDLYPILNEVLSSLLRLTAISEFSNCSMHSRPSLMD